ncbi:MAG: AI-2E family transporter [Actinobacteria bacterium]|nr:AI-2E family transporter [Actinomycetota bacterium]
MPGWVPRAILLFFLGVAALFSIVALFKQLRPLLLILLVSLFLAFALEPAANFLARRGWRRGVATGLVFFAVVVAISGFVAAMSVLVVDQVSSFADDAESYGEQIEDYARDWFDAEIDMEETIDDLTAEDGPLREFAANNAADIATAVLGGVFQAFTVALFTFYLVADGPRLRRTVCSVLRPEQQREVLRAWELAIDKTGGYIYSRALLAGLSAIATWIALTIIGVPYALALALWVGVISQFVPVVGTYIAGALPVTIAALNDPVDVIWTLGFIILYQQVENYLLAPRITAQTMELHPAVAFGTVIAGAAILGPVGAVLALPAAAVGQAFLSTYIQRHEVVESELTTDTRRKRRPLLQVIRAWRANRLAGRTGADAPETP